MGEFLEKKSAEKKIGTIHPSFKEKDLEDFEERFELEKNEARIRFKDLISMVNQRYENLSEKEKGEFRIHNDEILDSVIEIGLKNEFSPEEIKMLEIAAIWHDASKADSTPENFIDVPNYVLVTHGEKAAGEIIKILSDDFLRSKGFNENNFESIRLTISDAILQHMGPHPGFMSLMLKSANDALLAKGMPEVVHPRAVGKISKALLAADMRSLASARGRKKILTIRSSVPFFAAQDKQVSEEYQKKGIAMSPSEVALLSGFQSAEQALDMIEDEDDYIWVKKALEDSKGVAYLDVDGSEIIWGDVESKARLYETAKRLQEAA